MINTHRPDLANGKNHAQIIAMKSDAKLSREMSGQYVELIRKHLTGKGFDDTDANIYLGGYFLGEGGAEALLKGGSDQSAFQALAAGVGEKRAQRMIAANKSNFAKQKCC